MSTPPTRAALIAAAQAVSARAHAPYSGFHVGAALGFADGTLVTGANVENASYGLSLCAETVAVAAAMNAGARGGLVAVAVLGGPPGQDGEAMPGPDPVTPCGRWTTKRSPAYSECGSDALIRVLGKVTPTYLRPSTCL